jgi:hypothetical protein
MDREKEREIELESAMYTNCLLLGLDPSVIGVGASNSTPRVGAFRHSNPKLGEQLLYFILSSLRGPIQSSKVIFQCFEIFLHFHYFLCLICYFNLFFLFGSFRISIRFGRFSILLNRVIFVRYGFVVLFLLEFFWNFVGFF